MGLRRLLLLAMLATVGTLALAPNALAWTFSASGSVKCDSTTSQYVITWTLDNRSEPETLTVRESDRPAAVPVGGTVAKFATGTFTEKLAGTSTGSVTLTVKGNWPSDKTLRLRTATVSLPSGCTPPDVCPNIDGIQATVPAGLVKDASGKCVPVDVCPNLDGIQATIPSGLVKDAAGNCVPVDVCPNIEGIQTTVPSGLIKDAAGNCTPPPPPTDVCPNIEGIQTSVPSGLIKDVAGNCTPPPPPTDVCSNIDGIQTVTPAGFENRDGMCHCPPEKILVKKIVKKVVVKVKKVKAKPKAKLRVKGAKKTLKPRALPFTR
jgi:hypothetical protein